MSGIPDAVRALTELSPVEDLMLAVLREGLPGVAVQTLIADNAVFPFVMVRRMPNFGFWDADTRFTDDADVALTAYVADPNGDEDAALLSEAARVVLRDAWLGHKVVPGRGHFTRVDMTSAPRRGSDWATSAGPVQYADLPVGVWRYETIYNVGIKKASKVTLTP